VSDQRTANPAGIDKRAVLAALRARIRAQYEALTASQKTVQEGAIHEDNRAEHSKDTRAIEAQYLARGLAERAEKLREDGVVLDSMKLAAFGAGDRAATGALLAVEDDDGETLYFLVPVGGGESLAVDGHTVRTLTPASPLGASLAGRRAGDEITAELPGGRRELAIVWVC
jgi:transcription elongation GreA/GreB family factor